MLVIHNERLLDFLKCRYELAEVHALSRFLDAQGTFRFPALENGLFSAAIADDKSYEYTGYQNVWVRDNIHIAHAHAIGGKPEAATRTLLALMSYFKKCKNRFDGILSGEVDPSNPMNRPHVRFDGKNLSEIDQEWAHAQNDALGYFLWLTCRLARQGVFNLQRGDLEILGRFLFYFQAIRYWEDEDSGHWEETRKISASSIGTATAALEELRLLLCEKNLWDALRLEGRAISPRALDELIANGWSALKAILPAECVQPHPAKKREHDAALLFLIYPLEVLKDDMADRIVQDVIGHLQGDIGVRRYTGDSYWCADYKKKLGSEQRTADFSSDLSDRDRLLKKGEEAQWCIFDPILSAIFGLKFQKTRRKEDLDLQTHYLNRSLAHLTGGDSGFAPFLCPESYYLEDGRYVTNDITPLLWTQANLMVALRCMERSLDL